MRCYCGRRDKKMLTSVAGWVLLVFLNEGVFAGPDTFPDKAACLVAAVELQKKELPRPVLGVCVPESFVVRPVKS
jgi:hypothetical protein